MPPLCNTVTSETMFDVPAMVRQTITVGCPKEVKAQESRVGITPATAVEYIKNGHKVVVETQAGAAAGFTDEMYVQAGCVVKPNAKDVYASCEMIVKVVEPQAEEYNFIRPNQIVFCFFHFTTSRSLTEAMISRQAICIDYETVETEQMNFPIFTPMCEIKGRMCVQEGMKYLENPTGGSGVLLSGVSGVRCGKVMILGGGIVGVNAAKMAAGVGAEVVVLDVDTNRLRQLNDCLPANCRTLQCTTENINQEIVKADLVIGAVFITGAPAPRLITREHLKTMKPGSVIIDAAVEQGGCIETCVPTTHQKPTFVMEGVVHYCVPNVAGLVPYTSSVALNNATLAYGLQLANKGWMCACAENGEILKGLCIAQGKVTCKAVADVFNLPHVPVVDLVAPCLTNTKMAINQMNNRVANVTITA